MALTGALAILRCRTPKSSRPATEEQLLAALQEIGGDGDGIDLQSLGLDFGGTPGSDTTSSHEAGEAEETPEVETPLDED